MYDKDIELDWEIADVGTNVRMGIIVFGQVTVYTRECGAICTFTRVSG